jgi:hypothetical protein
MEMALETLKTAIWVKCSITSLSFLNIYLKRRLEGNNYFAVENIKVIAEGELDNHFSIGTIQVFCKIVTYLRSVALKVYEQNQRSYALNLDR